METRSRKRQQKEREIIRCSIFERDQKILSKQEKKNLWHGKSCFTCEQVRQLLDLCVICREPILTDNLILPNCQHTFCASCLHNYLNKTSRKWYRVWSEDGKPDYESFKCPTCKIQLFNIKREIHLKKKNTLYSALCEALTK